MTEQECLSLRKGMLIKKKTGEVSIVNTIHRDNIYGLCIIIGIGTPCFYDYWDIMTREEIIDMSTKAITFLEEI